MGANPRAIFRHVPLYSSSSVDSMNEKAAEARVPKAQDGMFRVRLSENPPFSLDFPLFRHIEAALSVRARHGTVPA